jgi:putative transposase
MPRRPLYRTSVLPYHVTARSNNREKFPVSLASMWELLGTECLTVRLKFGVEFHAVVLMPNHFHMILTVPESNLGFVMNNIMSNLTKKANRVVGRSGHVFGGPYYRTVIHSSRYYGHAFKYVYRNPVRAGLCDAVEDYRFSTLHGLIGSDRLLFPIHFPRIELALSLPAIEPIDLLGWLNTPFSKEAESLIQHGLRKPIFDKIICDKKRVEPEELRCLI